MSDVTTALTNLKITVGHHFEGRVTSLLDAQRAALSAPLTTWEQPYCYCSGRDEGTPCQMRDMDAVCPAVAKVYADLLPALLKRIGAEVTP